VSRETVELAASVHPIFFGEFAKFFDGLSDAFRDIGYRIRPVNRTMAEYLKVSDAGEADIEIGRWTADYPDSDTFLFGCVHSSSGAFRNYLSSPELDRLAEQGRAEVDPRVRHSVYRQAEEYIADQAVLLPLFHDQVYCFARPEVQGLTTIGQSNASIPYEDLWIRR
jgi:peptide/nickel transport system substrate-binding protein